MNIAEHDILSLIPQRPPFVMIDKLIHSDEQYSRSAFYVDQQNLFVKDGLFCEAGLTENIAQTCAARAGYIAMQQNKPVAIGYIGSVKNLEVFFLPAVSDVLETEIGIQNQVFDVSIISGKVLCNGSLAAQCEMKIFINQPK